METFDISIILGTVTFDASYRIPPVTVGAQTAYLYASYAT
jgi:hypothetical protein